MTIPLRAGDYVFGVRVNTLAAGELVRELFTDRLVPDADPPQNLSVYLAPESDEGPRELHRLYVSGTQTVRDRSPERVLEALWHELDMWDVRAAGVQPLLNATVVLRDGHAHVLPSRARYRVADRKWADLGFQLVDRRWVDVDLPRAVVTVPEVRLEEEGLERSTGGRLRALRLGQPTVATIASWRSPSGATSPAMWVVEAARQVLDRSSTVDRVDLGALVDLLGGITQVEAGSSTVVDDLYRLLEPRRRTG